MKAPLPSFTRLTLAVGAPKRKRALDDTGPSVLHDIWHKYTPGVLGDHEYERVMGEYDNDLHDNMQVLDVVMDIDLYLYLAGIDSYLDARDQDLANPNQTFWEGSNGELWKSVKDNKEQFTPPPVILELQVKTERTRAGDPRGYEVFRHEGRHRAWLAKYKYGYQRILVTVGVRWTTAEPWSFKDADRELRVGDTIQQQDDHEPTWPLRYACQVCENAELSPTQDPPYGSAYGVWKSLEY